MKTLIIYTSETGFTKKYSQWLAEKMNADTFELKDVKRKNKDFFDNYEAIVYAGWIMAGNVVKSKWFFKKAAGWKEKRLAIMAVGGSPNENPDVDATLKRMLNEEQRKYIKAFYCQGGFNYDKMKAPSRLMMKMFASALRKKPDEKSKQMAEYISKSYDISDIKFIEPIVIYLNGEKII